MTTLTNERPQVEFDGRNCADAYRHEDGSITYIVWDEDGGSHCNPREDDLGNIATLVQRNDRCIDLDSGEELAGAWEHFLGYGSHGTSAPTWGRGERSRHDREHMIDRYIAMFRPDILYFREYWSAGDSYGWGYVTRAAWDAAMAPPAPMTPAQVDQLLNETDDELRARAREAFNAEVRVYAQWANGEVYGGIHVSVGDPIVRIWDHGAYVDGYREDEDSCWGFLGYDDHKDITAQFTDSPVTEVLA